MGAAQGRFGIRPGEGRAAGLLVALFLAGGLARALTRSISYAGFLSRYPATDIPYVYVAVGLVLAALMPWYLRVSGRVPATTLSVGTLGALVAGQLVLWQARLAGVGLVDLVLPVWYEALSIMIALAMWSVVGRTLDVTQGRRLAALVGSGFPVGMLVGGLATPVAVSAAGATSLLVLSGLVLAVAVGLVLALRGHGEDDAPAVRRSGAGRRTAGSGDGSGRRGAATRRAGRREPALLADPYVRLLVGMFVCWTLAFYLSDYMFYERVGDRYADEDALASFMGVYSVALGVLTLGFGLFVTPRVVRRWGVPTGATLMPLGLTLGVLPSVAIGAVAGAAPAIFWPAFATKVGHYAFDTLDRAVRTVLYQPLRPQARLRVQALSEGLGAGLTTAASGVVLVVLVQGFGAGVVEAGWLLLVVLVGWLLLARAAGRAFPTRLAAALDQRLLRGTDVVLDATAVRMLRRQAATGHPDVVVYALDRLQEADDPGLPQLVVRLLDHRSPVVRADAVNRTAGFRDATVLAALRMRLATETDPVVLTRLCAALVADGGPAEVDAVADAFHRHAGSPDQGLLVTAAAGLLRRPGGAGDALVRELVTRWRASGRPDLVLTGDLAVAQGTGDPNAWRRVVEAVHRPALRDRAADAVVAAAGHGDPAAVVALVAALQDTVLRMEDTGIIATGGIDVRLVRLSRVAGRVATFPGGPGLSGVAGAQVCSALVANLGSPDPTARGQVVTDLVRAGWTVDSDDAARSVQTALVAESRLAVTVVALAQERGPMGHRPEVRPSAVVERAAEREALVGAALELERAHVLHRIVGLAALRDASGAVRGVVRALPPSGTPLSTRQRQYLGEVLEAVGERGVLPVVRALADPTTDRAYLAELRVTDPAGLRMATSPIARAALTSWTRTCLAAAATAAAASAPTVPVLSRSAGMASVVERVIVLKQVDLFSRVPDDVLASVAEVVDEVGLTADDPLFVRGDTASTMYVVVSGAVVVHDADRAITVLGPGEVVGELALLDDTVRSASVTAREDSLLLALDRASFDELMADHPQIARGIVRILAARLRARTDDVLARRG